MRTILAATNHIAANASGDRMQQESDCIHDRYPNPDNIIDRDAALSAASQYLLGETTIDSAALSLAQAQLLTAQALAAVQQIALMCVEDGMTEPEAARRGGVDRITIRKARG